MTHSPMHIDELVEHWTVLDEERELIAGKRGATRLGFAILLKFYTRHGRCPRGRSELADEVVGHVAKQVRVPVSEFGFYEWSGSTIEYHRGQIRTHLGFWVCTTADADKVTVWLAENGAHAERRPERVREELLKHLRQERIEPPTSGRITRIVASALHSAEVAWSVRIASRLSADTTRRIYALVGIDDGAETGTDDADDAAQDEAAETAAEDDGGGSSGLLALIKSAPGNVSLESMMTEIRKLEAVRSIGLPPGLFADVAPKVLAAWRARAAVEAPSHMRSHPRELTVLLLAALVCEREREITDTLVELLIATVHRIKARADSKVTKELINAFKRVTGKENILFRVADAARLFRSVTDILALRPVLARRGLHLRVESGLLSGIDLASDDPGTKMMVSVLAAVLEFQRDMISENTREGVAAAEASGKTLGRPTALDSAKAAEVVTAYRQGAAVKALARQHHVAPKTIRRILDSARTRELPEQLDTPPPTGEPARAPTPPDPQVTLDLPGLLADHLNAAGDDAVRQALAAGRTIRRGQGRSVRLTAPLTLHRAALHQSAALAARDAGPAERKAHRVYATRIPMNWTRSSGPPPSDTTRSPSCGTPSCSGKTTP
ncbi:DUF4158 domain-containing protein [Spirillospora sp. CA-108201]